jgi:hypothetical protein
VTGFAVACSTVAVPPVAEPDVAGGLAVDPVHPDAMTMMITATRERFDTLFAIS